MVSIVMTGIRKETSQLNVAKAGSTALYVDQGHANADNNNDGYSWDSPFASISAALADADPWTVIYIKDGTYVEEVVIPHENIKLIGIVQDGPSVASIEPAAGGVPLTCLYGYCEISGLSLVSNGTHACKVSGPGIKLHDLYIEVTNILPATKYGIWGNDLDSASIYNCYFDGKSSANVIGVFLDGGSVDCGIHGCYFTDWGDAVNPGYCIGFNDAQRCSVTPYVDQAGHHIPNRLISSYVGMYFYVVAGFGGHNIHYNMFSENSGYDIYDPNDPDTSGNSLDGNFYAYTNWFLDYNHDGLADLIVDAYGNFDYHPLGGVSSWMTPNVPRVGTV